MCRCAGTLRVGGGFERLADLLELSAHDLRGLNNIGLVFLGVLAEGLDKGNQNLIHIKGKILWLLFTGGAGGVAPASSKQATYWSAEALCDLL